MLCVSAGFMACSDDDVVSDHTTGGGTDDAVSAYLSIDIVMPETTDTRADDATRADNEGDANLVGTENEYTVKKVYVYAFERNTVSEKTAWRLKETQTAGPASITTGTPNSTSSTPATGTATAKFTGLKKSEAGTEYHVYVSVNAEAVDQYGKSWTADGQTVTETDFLEQSRFDLKTTISSEGKESTSTGKEVKGFVVAETFASKEDTTKLPQLSDFSNSGLVMASRQFDNMTGVANSSTPYAVVKIYNTNTETTPSKVTIAVERVMARLDLGLTSDYKASDVTTPDGVAYATVTLDKYFPVNISKQAYLFRHTAKGTSSEFKSSTTSPTYTYDNLANLSIGNWKGSEWNMADYVVDPLTTQKTVTNYNTTDQRGAIQSMYYNAIHTATCTINGKSESKLDAFAPLRTAKNNIPPTIGYCLENTTLATCQQKDYSTGIVFSGLFTPKDDAIFGYYNGAVYSKAELKQLEEYATATVTTDDNSYNVEAKNTALTSAIQDTVTAHQAYAKALADYNDAVKEKDESEALWNKIKPADYVEGSTTLTEGTDAYNVKARYDKAKTALETKEIAKSTEETTLKEKLDAYKTAEDEKKLAETKSSAKTNQKQIEAALNDEVLYFYNYQFYTSIEALDKVMALPNNLVKSTDGTYDMKVSVTEDNSDKGKSNVQMLSEYGVTQYLRETAAEGENPSTYRTYYLYVLKHYEYTSPTSNSDAAIMSPMKFAIVRNNVYRMTVSGVSGLGSGSVDPTDPDPTDTYYPGPNPDEDREIYLNVKLDILNWVLRDQGDIVLK